MVKLTFSVDDETANTIRSLARRKKKSQSLVVREAVAAYAGQEEKLGREEWARKLRLLDALATERPTRAQPAIDRELREIRRPRRAGWQRAAD